MRYEFFRLYDPVHKRFCSVGKSFTLPALVRRRAEYIEQVALGIGFDIPDWVRNTIIVKIDKDDNILEAYCGECRGIVDHETADVVCSQCVRVVEPELLRS